MPATAVGTARMAAQEESLRRDLGLLSLSGHQARFEGEGQHLAQGFDLFLHPPDMVGHIAELVPHHIIDHEMLGMLQPPADIDQRQDRVAQAQQIAPQRVEPLDLLGVQRLGGASRSSMISTSSCIASSTSM
jgi:hypothetical protein